MNKDNVDIQDYLDDMADGFLDGMGTNEEFEKVQTLISQAFCFGIYRQQQEIESLKTQLAQYQSDDYVLVPKVPSEEMCDAGCNAWSYRIDCFEVERIYKAMIEAQEQHNDAL